MKHSRHFRGRHTILTGAILLVFASANAKAESIEALLAQLSKAEADLGQANRELPAKVQDTLTLMKKHETEISTVNRQLDALEAGEGAALAAQLPVVNAACTGSFAQDQIAAARARCESIRGPYNARIGVYNQQLNPLNARIRAINQAEDRRSAAALELKASYERLDLRVRTLRAALKQARLEQCGAALSRQNEADVRLGSVCFDGASANAAALPGGNPATGPAVTPNRTPEQAIKDYRDSGPAQPGVKRKPAPPPPPPPKNP